MVGRVVVRTIITKFGVCNMPRPEGVGFTWCTRVSYIQEITRLLRQVRYVLANSGFLLWLISISGEGSLPEITLSDASKLASTLYFLFDISVYVLFIEILQVSNIN